MKPLAEMSADEQREQLLQTVAAVGAQLARLAEALTPAVTAAAQQLAALYRALQDAGLIDANGNPTGPADRPAWQTPYGPPQHRH
ncbi:hypothetical protein E6W39_24385 [Kitasatospora acidiphila]|uniref:Uncharacterized protein n=1 Tax=Kitasatospora acidiphila TaxID=2567942 RepID=A0A540W6Z5_9ACTN|nr:hypothetical protein [Kitasatospora acidiphila]TQF04790.1 hypothetical protein E6W39_24385 [Kitasatospora acidiphila]